MEEALEHIYTAMKKAPSERERKLIKRAYVFAKEAHEEQKRFSGEPYFNHVYATARNLATFGMDTKTISAGFLHDTLEDTEVTESQLRRKFGKTVLFLVEGVTKLGTLRYRGLKRHTESLRKLFVASSYDVRVLVIKFADRLHNVSTLEYVRKDKQERIALETLEIYAPLADRMGMGDLRGLLEEYSFPYAYPKKYQEVRNLLKQKSRENEKHLKKVYRTLKRKLAEEGFGDVEMRSRIKGTYSLYKKLQKYKMDIAKIYDISAIRVIVDDKADCYRVLGLVHSLWRPIPGRVKDYIAFPKPNGYQSLHTNIFIGDGGVTEIQIRSKQMDEEARFGIASHMLYKAGMRKRKGERLKKNMRWIDDLLMGQKDVEESDTFLKNLKTDFFEDRVFVFTPKHDVIDLPKGASPIDLAYAVHSDIGHHITGAKINGTFTAINKELKNGDIVEIATDKKTSPKQKWLASAKTVLAKRQIRAALQETAGK